MRKLSSKTTKAPKAPRAARAPKADKPAGEARAAIPQHVQARHDAIVAERARLEQELNAKQERLREIPLERRTRVAATDHPDAAPQLAEIDQLKAEIGRVSLQHAELARAIALVSGGTNYPLPGQ
jgi:hypothetical protein